ncbi:MAG: baseplate J/gp47 family protein [Candidatus Limnocylindria bacterium]|nr:baseplate J/gp47 family protein [Candidatus Limnocylindria bacterium]
MSRTVIELPAGASLLDAADRIEAAPADGDIALVIPVGAPVARSGVLLAVAHRLAGRRPFSIVSADARARAIAASAHVRAYASLAALERHEVDPTEREHPNDDAVRRVARPGPGAGLGRWLAVAASLAAAALVTLAIALPAASVTVAPTAKPVGPQEFDLRAGPGGEIAAQQLSETVAAHATGTATGTRTVEAKATGVARFTNKTTDDIRLPRGTLVRAGSVRFLTTEERLLSRSLLVPFLLSTADIPIEAADPGPSGNVAAGKIAASDPVRYDATNPAATKGGERKQVPVVTQADYDLAARGIPAALDAAAQAQAAKWRAQVRSGSALAGGAAWTLTQQLPASQLVGQEVVTFEILVAASVVAFAVPSEQPRAAALARLRTAVDPGNDIDETGAAVDVLGAPRVTDGGVIFRVRASALQFTRPNAAALRSLLAGRAPSEAEALLLGRGLRLADLQTWPAWWPRLPLLDARIRVVEAPSRGEGR